MHRVYYSLLLSISTMKKQIVTIKIETATLAKAKRIAKKEKRSFSAQVELWIENHLAAVAQEAK